MEITQEIKEDISVRHQVKTQNPKCTFLGGLPERLENSRGKLEYFCKQKNVGVIKSEYRDQNIFVMFNSNCTNSLNMEFFTGQLFTFDAFLMDKSAYIPYLAALVWSNSPTKFDAKKISCELKPEQTCMYKENVDHFSKILEEGDGKFDGYNERGNYDTDRKTKRQGSRERLPSNSSDELQYEEIHAERLRTRKFTEEFNSAKASSKDTYSSNIVIGQNSSLRARVRGRFRIMRGATVAKTSLLSLSKPKLAIGRNVFPDSDEEGKPNLQTSLRCRPRGRFIRICRGALPGFKLKKLVRGSEDFSFDERPGLGFSLSELTPPKESLRWKRWQKLSRAKYEDDELSQEPRNVSGRRAQVKKTSPTSSAEEFGSNCTDINGKSTKSNCTKKKYSEIFRVSVFTYENEEVGILSSENDARVLFHINQVWVNHLTAGYCPFAEIYSRSDLSKHFYPGREVSCYIRVIPRTHDVTRQAEAVWLQGTPPAHSLYRSPELQYELNFHLAEYLSGRFGKLEMLLSVDKHSSMKGFIQEYVSNEMGLVRLLGKDNGVALFHLDQVWIYEDGSWIFYKEVMKSPISVAYLPIGTKVSLSVRKLPCSANSHLRYQALVIWNKDASRGPVNDCKSLAEKWPEVKQIPDGQVPPAYVQLYALPDNQARLIKSLDTHFDHFKELAKLALKNINAVPVLLNLLPESWEAKVYKIVDDENGVIMIKSKRSSHNLCDDTKLMIRKMFAIFHINDVYGSNGENRRKSPAESMIHLIDKEVDLTARSIVGDGAYDGVFAAASQINLSLVNPNVACPVLQAITVFIKERPGSELNMTYAPKPTVLRSYPEGFHCNAPGTAYYLNCQLLTRLDLKAMNFFNATCQAKMQKEVINGIPMAYFHQTKKSFSTDKHEQMKLIADMEKLDTNETSKLIFGSYRNLPVPPIQPRYPQTMNNVACSPRLLFRQGMFAKEGIMLCEIPISGGHHIAVYAFFDMSNYKFCLAKERKVKDFAEIMPVYTSPTLMAHITLVNSANPIPYVATAVWNPIYWPRCPDTFGKMDDIFLQKYERITGLISQGSTVNSAKLVYDQFQDSPPDQKETDEKIQPSLSWSSKTSLLDAIGRVTSLIDDNYGLAVIKFGNSMSPHDRFRAIILFDTCDLWLGEHTASELNLSLHQCMNEGDYIKVRALLVPESENVKNIRYLATGVVTGRSKTEVRDLPITQADRLDSIDSIHPEKLNNFYQVVSIVCSNIPGEAEDEVLGVSTDDEFDNMNINTSYDPNLRQASIMSMDAFEEQREKKKHAKALECQKKRKKMKYCKETREKLLSEMKLANQLMWKCTDCQISCGKPGMEKHLTLKSHWDKVFENYCQKLHVIKY